MLNAKRGRGIPSCAPLVRGVKAATVYATMSETVNANWAIATMQMTSHSK